MIGLSLAWELSKRGTRVSIVESGAIGGGASWAGAGILPPAPRVNLVDPYDQLLSLSHELHADWAGELRELTGIHTGFRKCGGIYLAISRGEYATLTANEGWWQEHGIGFEKLDRQQLGDFEPALCRPDLGIKAAWHLPDEWQLRTLL